MLDILYSKRPLRRLTRSQRPFVIPEPAAVCHSERSEESDLFMILRFAQNDKQDFPQQKLRKFLLFNILEDFFRLGKQSLGCVFRPRVHSTHSLSILHLFSSPGRLRLGMKATHYSSFSFRGAENRSKRFVRNNTEDRPPGTVTGKPSIVSRRISADSWPAGWLNRKIRAKWPCFLENL
jgi:hypothetical protein